MTDQEKDNIDFVDHVLGSFKDILIDNVNGLTDRARRETIDSIIDLIEGQDYFLGRDEILDLIKKL